jgi:hypothetical protein
MNQNHEISCAWVIERLEPYIAGDLDADAHAAARGHLATCASCREAMRQADPLMIFADLADRPRPAAAWDGFWEGIQAALPDHADRTAVSPPARTHRAPRRHAAVWLAAAAAIVLLVAAYVLTARFQGFETDPGAGPAPLVASAQRPAGAGAQGTESSVQALLAAGMPLPQTVERVNTPGARQVQVFSMAYRPGAGVEPAGAADDRPAPEQVTELVLIVDAGLDL